MQLVAVHVELAAEFVVQDLRKLQRRSGRQLQRKIPAVQAGFDLHDVRFAAGGDAFHLVLPRQLCHDVECDAAAGLPVPQREERRAAIGASEAFGLCGHRAHEGLPRPLAFVLPGVQLGVDLVFSALQTELGQEAVERDGRGRCVLNPVLARDNAVFVLRVFGTNAAFPAAYANRLRIPFDRPRKYAKAPGYFPEIFSQRALK